MWHKREQDRTTIETCMWLYCDRFRRSTLKNMKIIYLLTDKITLSLNNLKPFNTQIYNTFVLIWDDIQRLRRIESGKLISKKTTLDPACYRRQSGKSVRLIRIANDLSECDDKIIGLRMSIYDSACLQFDTLSYTWYQINTRTRLKIYNRWIIKYAACVCTVNFPVNGIFACCFVFFN